MVFYPPKWIPAMPDPPDSVTLEQFMNNEDYGRYPLAKARHPYVCGLTGRSHSADEVVRRTDFLARAIAKRLNFDPAEGTEWDRVVALYSFNTIDYVPCAHAVHRLSGIVTPASAAYGVAELEHQLRSSGARAIFTCQTLLDNAVKAAKIVGIPQENIFILPLPQGDKKIPFVTIEDLINEGKSLPEIKPLKWIKGQGARQIAFLCFSSGTSGLPKAVMITHRNVIANILQSATFDSVARKKLGIETHVTLGVLPFSHIYGLTLVAHVSQYRGDETIVMPRFELTAFLKAVEHFKLEHLSVVPPMLIQIISNPDQCAKYDLSSVRFVFCGAAPLGEELQQDLLKAYPKWHIGQGYGMTEASPLVVTSSEVDTVPGSSGALLPGALGKIIDLDGNEITEYEKRGELLAQGPMITAGYLNNEKANAETYVHHEDGRWLRTGDEVLVRKVPSGDEHFFIVDRIKELIKVKGHQVAPAELEAHLLAHDLVSDCAVIPVPDKMAGEVPKAFVVKARGAAGKSDDDVKAAINKHVKDHKASYKALKGGIEFIDVIPKSPSGKILRRLLRDKEKEARKKTGAKL